MSKTKAKIRGLDPIIKKYRIRSVKSITKLDIDTTNNLYKITTDNNILLLKEMTGFDKVNINTKKEEINIAKHLQRKGINTIIPIKNTKGNYITKKEDKYYTLYPYYELDKDPHPKLKEIVKLHRKFHEATKDYKKKHGFHTQPMHIATIDITQFIKYNPRLKTEALIRIAEKKQDKFSKQILKEKEFIKDNIIDILEGMAKAKFTEKTLLHYDYKLPNIFYMNRKFLAISDFEFSHIGYIETDIAKAARVRAETNKGFSIKKFKDYIKEYHTISKTKPDWELYYILSAYSILRRIIFFAKQTLTNKQDLSKKCIEDIKILKSINSKKEELLKN